ncbi:PREDICTED: eukaryotic translation initiation factor 4E-binding protein 1-like [Rhagoletis zephyria]|uniref:eukaryotic translation initiation factor 4E-binding protein 1-like n=1 Tax=Rhagoletis zephyria TaxID=28612 RepID=UPI0008117792|nr:PREDICTED: eukaryotic translation initiation factor 4E-binding protein 1-like [Rhagoletis zephyria]
MTTKNSGAKPIPAFRRVTINSDSDLPDRGVAATPGGTLFSTTPGGTRIIYDRAFLMNLRNSPLAKSPPKMAYIAGVTNISAENGQANLTKKGKESQKNVDA